MKLIVSYLLVFLIAGKLCAQKPNLTDTSYKTWTQVFNGNISPDGKYADYEIRTTLYSPKTFVVTATDKSWEKKFQDLSSLFYSRNGKEAYGLLNGKLLRLLLSTDRVDTIAASDQFELLNFHVGEYLAYSNSQLNELRIVSTDNNNNYTFNNVLEYWKEEGSDRLVIRQKGEKDSLENVLLLDLKNKRQVELYKGVNVQKLIFDQSGKSLAFIAEKNGHKSIWHYTSGTSSARLLLNDSTLKNGLKINTNDFWQFTTKSDRLLFSLDEQPVPYKDDFNAPDVWSYEDKMVYQKFKMRKFQTSGLEYGKNLCSIDLKNGRLERLITAGELPVRGVSIVGNLLVINSVKTDLSGRSESTSYFLLNLATKEKTAIALNNQKGLWTILISPNQKNVIYFDADKQKWINYNISAKKNIPFAESIINELFFYQETIRAKNDRPLAVFGWIEGTDHILMQGTHDVWEVSISNQIKPVKLTPHPDSANLVFSLAILPRNGIIRPSENLVAYSQNLITRDNCIYRVNLKNNEFRQLHCGSFYLAPLYSEVGTADLKKAENAEAYLFVESRVDQSRNYLFTTDFKKIVKLSENQPEKAYNWMTSELMTYKDADGNLCQGILYKPENFDSQKKYPVIFTIYQEQSYGLHKHLSPEWWGTGINIPLLVSNGYLVCKPDVYIAKGKIGEYALKSVLAAVDHLSKYTWIDSNKFALTGHSLGGFETNYILTRTNRFAAAMSSSSISSIINNYNDLWGGDSEEKQSFTMYSAPWMGKPLQDDIEAYIENSPILHARNITTPLLLFHHPADGASPFYHSTQFFVQLRSMGKKVWLVSYENEGHGVLNPINQLDYNRKVMSYFDFCLKGNTKPKWLSRHIEY